MKAPTIFSPFLLSFQPPDLSSPIQPSHIISQHQYSAVLLCNILACLSLFIFQIIHFYAFLCLNTLSMWTLFPQILLAFIFIQRRQMNLAIFFTLSCTHCLAFVLAQTSDATLFAACFLLTIPSSTYILKPSYKISTISSLLCILQAIYFSCCIQKKFHGLYIEEQSLEITVLTVGLPLFVTLVSALFYCQQITEKNLWQNIQEYQQKLQTTSSEHDQIKLSQDAFISAISHETRNPLNFIHCTLECLTDYVKDSHLQPLLLDAKRNSLILLNLINNALDAAKLSSNKLEIFSLEVNPAELILKALKLYSLEFKNKQISLRLLIDQTLPSKIRTDETRILQILHNLLSNALHATPQNGNITLYTTWIPQKTHKNDLLTPIKSPRKTSHFSFEEPQQSQEKTFETTEESVYSHFDEFDRQETESNLKKLKYLQTARIKSLKKDTFSEVSLNEKSYLQYTDLLLLQETPPLSPLQDGPKSFEDSDGFLKIQITDTGCGILPENIAKAFQKFNRVKESEGPGQGVGLGLWISKQICERMEGDIKLYSEAKKGSSVVFYIRVKSGLNL